MHAIDFTSLANPTFRIASRAKLASLGTLLVILALTVLPSSARAGDDATTPEAPESEVSEQVESPLVAEEAVGKLGTVVKGQRPEHTFVVRNTGSDPLTIATVGTYVELEVLHHPGTLAPGESGEIRVRVDSTKVTGAHRSRLEIYEEGKEDPIRELGLEYTVVSRLSAHPGYARWIYVRHEKEGTIRQTVYSTDGADFDVESVTPPMSAIEVSFHEAKTDERNPEIEGSQWIVETTLDAEAPVGPIEGVLSVKTTHPDQEELRIPVSGFVRPVLFVSPQVDDLGTLSNDRPRHMTYTVRNFATEPIVLGKASSDIPGVVPKVEPIEEGRRYRVIVELDLPAMEIGPFSGVVTVKTDSEKTPTLTIGINGRVVEAGEAETAAE